MTPTQFRETCAALGAPTIPSASRLIGVCPRTISDWRAGTVAVPVPIARLLLLLLETPAFAARILAEHPAPPAGKAGRETPP
jgi:hypothetical protein